MPSCLGGKFILIDFWAWVCNQLRRVCLSAVNTYLLCRQKPGKGQYLLVCLVMSRWNMSLPKASALPLLEPCENQFDFSHLFLSLQHKRKKTNELEATVNIYPCDIWQFHAGEMGTGSLSFPGLYPIPRLAMGVLCHKAVPSFELQDLVVWKKPPAGGGGTWDGSQAKNDGW